MTPASKWVWFGNNGHLCVGRWCRFHLCTLVGKYLVSTVGEYVPPSVAQSESGEVAWLKKNWPGEDIGYNRKYETMVFLAGDPCHAERCGGCGVPDISGSELDFSGYSTAKAATDGHMELCRKWARK